MNKSKSIAICLGILLIGITFGYVLDEAFEGQVSCSCPQAQVCEKSDCYAEFKEWVNESQEWQQVAEQVNKTMRLK